MATLLIPVLIIVGILIISAVFSWMCYKKLTEIYLRGSKK
jgi:hypothetical protein